MKLKPINYNLIIYFSFLYFTFLISYHIKTGFDTYWHIKVGEWIVNHKSVPTTGIFSLSNENEEWVAHCWLSEVIIYTIYRLAGWGGLGFMAIASVTTSVLIMLRYTLQNTSPKIAFIFLVLSYGIMSGHIMPRPHILTFPLMTLWLYQMLKSVDNATAPPIWLTLMSMLWANLHGSFLLAPAYAFYFAIVSLYNAKDQQKRYELMRHWSVFISLIILSLFINPYGLKGVLLPIQLTGQTYSTSIISEWLPLNFQKPQIIELCLLIIIALPHLTSFKLPLFRLLFLLGLTHLSLKHSRYATDLFSLQAPMILSGAFYSTKIFKSVTLSQIFLPCRTLIFYNIFYAFLIGTYFTTIKDMTYPISKSIESMIHKVPIGNIFNSYELGGYLIFYDYKPFIDSRAELYKDDFIKSFHEMTTLQNTTPDQIMAVLDKYQINTVFLTHGSPINLFFSMDNHWQIIHKDDVTTVFAKIY